MLFGRLHELTEAETKAKIQVDALCKNVIDLFAPMDQAMTYVDAIDVRRLRVYTSDIERRIATLHGLQVEIKQLKKELGEE